MPPRQAFDPARAAAHDAEHGQEKQEKAGRAPQRPFGGLRRRSCRDEPRGRRAGHERHRDPSIRIAPSQRAEIGRCGGGHRQRQSTTDPCREAAEHAPADVGIAPTQPQPQARPDDVGARRAEREPHRLRDPAREIAEVQAAHHHVRLCA